MKTAFISYATKDHDTARLIKDMLEARGVPCWIAPDDITPGKDYAEEIILGIESTQVTILLLSEYANASQFVKREIERAVSKNKPVLPVRLADVQPSPAMELFVSSAHWVEAWQEPLAPKIDLLAASILKLTSKGNEASPKQVSASLPVSALANVAQKPKEGSKRHLYIGGFVAAMVAVGSYMYLTLPGSPINRPAPDAVNMPAPAAAHHPAKGSEPATKVPAVQPLAVPSAETRRPEARNGAATPSASAAATTRNLPHEKVASTGLNNGSTEPSPKSPVASSRFKQCSNILERASLGEPLSPEEQTLLKTRCP